MMSDESFTTIYPHLGNLHETCKREGLVLPENAYDASAAISTALSASDGDEQGALRDLTTKFGRGVNKRGRPVASGKNNIAKEKDDKSVVNQPVEDGGQERGSAKAAANKEDDGLEDEEEPADIEEDEVDEDEDEVESFASEEKSPESAVMPPHKRMRLVEEVREKPAANAANQKIVDAFTNYGEQQLDRGHTGKGVSHLRAALHIRDYPDAIKSGMDARAVPMVGEKMATQVEQVLKTGELVDDTPWLNVSSSDVSAHTPPDLVVEVQNGRAKCPENQVLVDELAKFGEHELYFGSSGKGTTHLRAARELQLTDVAVTSGSQARELVPLVGDVIADKIDQILKHGCIIQDAGGVNKTAPIVQDLRDKPATRPDNQSIVDALVDYGDSHLHSGHRGKGITHLRAAQAIRNSSTVVLSGKQAMEAIPLVGERVGAKIDQILERGHADSEDEEGEEEEEDSEYGVREQDAVLPPLAREVRSQPAQVQKNQLLVDALATHGEAQLSKRHTGRGTAFLRAALQLRIAEGEVTTGAAAQALGRIGDKVATYIDKTIAKIFGGAVEMDISPTSSIPEA